MWHSSNQATTRLIWNEFHRAKSNFHSLIIYLRPKAKEEMFVVYLVYILNGFLYNGKHFSQMIQIKVKKRIGNEASFVNLCRKAVTDAFENKPVGQLTSCLSEMKCFKSYFYSNSISI